MSKTSAAAKLRTLLSHMDVAEEIGAYQTLSLMVLAFGSRLVEADDVALTARFHQHMASVARVRLRAIYDDCEVEEQGTAAERARLRAMLGKEALEEMTTYIFDKDSHTPLGALRRHHAARNVAVSIEIFDTNRLYFDSLKDADALETASIMLDISHWREAEKTLGLGAMLNRNHPMNARISIQSEKTPQLQESPDSIQTKL